MHRQQRKTLFAKYIRIKKRLDLLHYVMCMNELKLRIDSQELFTYIYPAPPSSIPRYPVPRLQFPCARFVFASSYPPPTIIPSPLVRFLPPTIRAYPFVWCISPSFVTPALLPTISKSCCCRSDDPSVKYLEA